MRTEYHVALYFGVVIAAIIENRLEERLALGILGSGSKGVLVQDGTDVGRKYVGKAGDVSA
jgi:hypothetical protein